MKITYPRRDEQLIGALVPTARSYRRPEPAPLPTLPALPPPDGMSPAEVLLGMARPDRSGRVTERSLLAALNWHPGHRIGIDQHGGALVICTAATGKQAVGSRGELRLPYAARAICGIVAGHPVVLVAVIPCDLLVVYLASTVARLLTGLHADLLAACHAH